MKDRASVIQATTSNAPPVEITTLICACSRGQVSRPGDRQTRSGTHPECFRIGGWQDVGSAYRELSGAGGIRVKVPKVLHVLNASGLAVGRMLAALIESCQEQGA